jgi:hemoglobin-like flavoprotein
MTPEQKILVQQSFEQVVPIRDTAATLFYARLFELDPALKPLFKGDMTQQGRLLMTMIGTAVRGLDDLGALRSAVRALGVRHTAYGVSAKDYDTVAAALLWTLEQGLGEAFSPATRAAWIALYGMLAGTMKQAAAAAPAAPAA